MIHIAEAFPTSDQGALHPEWLSAAKEELEGLLSGQVFSLIDKRDFPAKAIFSEEGSYTPLEYGHLL